MPDPDLQEGQGPGPARTGLATPDPAPQGDAPSPPERSSRWKVWLHRLSVLLFVFVCAAAGVLLVILPWTRQWTDNVWLFRYPALQTVVSNGFVRGLCSGLGLLDIWIGFSEAIHYHEERQV
jgi:hypothetical protein